MAKEFVERFVLGSRILRGLHPLSKAEFQTGLKPSLTVNELMNSHIYEEEGMDIGDSKIYTAAQQKPDGGVEVMALVDTKLAGLKLVTFLNQFAPVKMNLKPDSGEINPLYDVGTDWGYMSSAMTEGHGTRTKLDKIHERIPGFKEFIPHAPEWVKALGLPVLASSYHFYGPQQAIVPVVNFTVDTDLNVTWKHEVIQKAEKAKMVSVYSQYPELRGRNFDMVNFDRMLGMCMPAYVHPDMSSHWPKELVQTMRAAQMPVLNYGKQREHNVAKPFVKNLISLAK